MSTRQLAAPDGLTDEAVALWREHVDEFRKLGALRASLRDLVDGWARAWDAQRSAEAPWEAAGRPESEEGSMGQERRHHLASAKERADRHLDGLAAKLERAGFRRAPRPRPRWSASAAPAHVRRQGHPRRGRQSAPAVRGRCQ
jgi:phage terminase small subunit